MLVLLYKAIKIVAIKAIKCGMSKQTCETAYISTMYTISYISNSDNVESLIADVMVLIGCHSWSS